jgi:chromosome segregation protein
MKLIKIKLAGFKSFVDPTTVPLASQLVGIVGPNGCGKSNIIDAVRWVMGESSAKYLRGESMTDVIFNGSTQRQPVGLASIELVFDNTHSLLTGEYATYQELSIKRVVDRDSQSVYYLNNTRCRRRDVADVFMGTGLGPRSYAIIEQGMISRFIEAKPEELRLYLEEAAGISKYKERRRETQGRIQNTQDNLNRVNDIREELARQLSRLEAQAAVAAEYRRLQEKQFEFEKTELGLRYQKLKIEDEKNELILTQKNIAFEALNALIEKHNADLEQERLQGHVLQNHLQSVQAEFYKVENELSRCEQRLQHEQAQAIKTKELLFETQQLQQQTRASLATKTILLTTLEQDKNKKLLEKQAAENQKNEGLQLLRLAEAADNAGEKRWQTHIQAASDQAHGVEQRRATIEKHEALLVRAEKRLEALKVERAQLVNILDVGSVETLTTEINTLQTEQEEAQQLILTLTQQGRDLQETYRLLEKNIYDKQKQVEVLKGRLSSLETLQENALGKNQQKLQAWLTAASLKDAPRFAESLQVESGWEKAIEMVFQPFLQGIVLPKTAQLSDGFGAAGLPPSGSVFFEQTQHEPSLAFQSPDLKTVGLKTLASQIQAPFDVSALLQGIYCAEDVPTALALLPTLNASESVVTPDGQWFHHHYWMILGDGDQQAGILSREQHIRFLKNDIQALESHILILRTELLGQKSQITKCDDRRAQNEQGLRVLLRKISDLKSELSGISAKIAHQDARCKTIDLEFSDLSSQMSDDLEMIRVTRSQLEDALIQMHAFSLEKRRLEQEGQVLKSSLKSAQIAQTLQKESFHRIELEYQKLESSLIHLRQEISDLEKQDLLYTDKKIAFSGQQMAFEKPIEALKLQLQDLIEKKKKQESDLKEIQITYQSKIDLQTQFEKQSVELRKQQEKDRSIFEHKKIESRDIKTRLEDLQLVFSERALDPMMILSELTGTLSLQSVRQTLAELRDEIIKLGAVNLAAIEEFQTESVRKQYLDLQQADLEKALAALQNAIHLIDTETQNRFKETFDIVDQHFKRLFPKIFGGGQAHLSMTGENILDTGIGVIAQPPGKRNASIHLLSGGEKALTAIALVFAIFKLNPAPFCILDEVDAPLDDVNVGHFCKLVHEMSSEVQFIFITHNKVTMTLAEHLIGVTMREPGVSRLVAVDVEEAISLVGV